MYKQDYSKNKHCIECNKSITNRSIRCRFCANKLRRKIKQKSYCQICGKELSLYKYKLCQKHANIQKAKDGKIGHHGQHINYKGIHLKSGWEEAFVKWCDKRNIKWLYEPKTFDLGETTYTPDFYLPEFKRYIEIKGFWRDDAKKKFNLCRKNFKINLVLCNKKVLQKLGVL
jgi:predicted nuclease of restriction endonuclease-like RecB superfamily